MFDRQVFTDGLSMTFSLSLCSILETAMMEAFVSTVRGRPL